MQHSAFAESLKMPCFYKAVGPKSSVCRRAFCNEHQAFESLSGRKYDGNSAATASFP